MRFTRFAKARPGHKAHVRGEMNKTEQRYQDHLATRKLAGEIQDYAYEPIRLRLAQDNAFYAPDFGVLCNDDVYEIHECKAGRVDKTTGKLVALEEEAARVRRKLAAELHPFRLVLAVEWPKKSGGGFDLRGCAA